MLDEVEQRRNSSFLNDPSSTNFGSVDQCLRIPLIWQTSEQINCGLPSITAHRISQSPLLFSLAQKYQGYTTCSDVKECVSRLLSGGETSDQWSAKGSWFA